MRRHDRALRSDVLALAHELAVLVLILGSLLGIPMLLIWLSPSTWGALAVGLGVFVLLVAPVIALARHRSRGVDAPWPVDVEGRRVGRLWDTLGLNQRKRHAALTGVPDLCSCGSGEPYERCCARRD